MKQFRLASKFCSDYLRTTQAIMGLTNFHSPSDMLARASGSKYQCQAIIQEFGRPIYFSSNSFTQETIDQYSWRLKYGHLDQWASPTEEGVLPITITKTPDPLKIPKLCIAGSFKPYALANDLASRVDYILLVAGNRGANLKLVLHHDLHDAGVAIFHEGMNGYSVVFSGVVSKEVLGFFLNEPDKSGIGGVVSFRKVDSIEQLLEGSRKYERTYMNPDFEVLVL